MKQVFVKTKQLVGVIISLSLCLTSIPSIPAMAVGEKAAGTVTVGNEAASGTMNLTETGTVDWMHLVGEGADGDVINRKSNGNGGAANVIQLDNLNGDPQATMGDAPITYTWTDGNPTQSQSGTRKGAVYIYNKGQDVAGQIPVEAGYSITIPSADEDRVLSFATGVWNCGAEIKVYVNDNATPVYTSAVEGKKYVVDIPSGNKVVVKALMNTKTHGDGNLNLSAIALGVKPPNPISVVVSNAGGEMNLTETGNVDWVHMVGADATVNRKSNGNGGTVDLIKIDNLSGQPLSTFKDSPIRYSWTDGSPTQQNEGTTQGGVFNYKQGQVVSDITDPAGYKISIPAANVPRVLSFASGVWNAAAGIKIYVNGSETPIYSNDELNAGGNVINKKYVATIRSGNSVEVVCQFKSKAHNDGNLNLAGVALGSVEIPAEGTTGAHKSLLADAILEATEMDLDGIAEFFLNQLNTELAYAQKIVNKEMSSAAYYEAYLWLKEAITAAEANQQDAIYKDASNPGLAGSFGWEGDKHAPIASIDGSYRLRDRGNITIRFGVGDVTGKMKWYNKEGYLPCYVSEYSKNGMDYTIENFADMVEIDGKKFEIAYSRMTTKNTNSEAKRLPKVSAELVPINTAAAETTRVEAGQTVVREYAIAADRFSNSYAFPTDEVVAGLGTFDSHYNHMKTYWNERLAPLAQITKLPDEKLINAYKAGYIYTLIVRDDLVQSDSSILKSLHVGENGYDEMFDHDTIGIVASLLTMGDFTYAKDYLATLPAQLQYDDAKWKYSWPYALYLMKTGDSDFIKEKFDTIKKHTHNVETDRVDNGEGIIKQTYAIDSQGSWLIDNWAALAGLTTYRYLCDSLYTETQDAKYKTESEWAVAEYNSLLKVVEQTQRTLREKYNYPYLSIDMYVPTEDSARSDARDGNWASMFLFGRWAWDGYLFGANQEGSEMINLIDSTYTHGFDRRKNISDTIYNFGGYPHGIFSSAYNAGYGSSALRGEQYRDAGIKGYQFMINEAMSSPFGWWEGVDYQSSESPWDIDHAKGGGGSNQHIWGQSTASKVLFDSLIAEKSNGSVIVGRGIPSEWIVNGKQIEIENYPVNKGKRIGYNITTTGNKVTVTITGDNSGTPISLELIPFKNNILNAGGLSFNNAKGTVSVPAGTKTVTVTMGKAANKASLQAKYNQLKNVAKGNYTDQSYAAFDTARKNANTIILNTAATQTQVDQALAALDKAYKALTLKPVTPTVKVGKVAKPTAKVAAANTTKVTWKKVSGATGYEVEVKTTAKGKFKKVKDTKTLSFTQKSLKYNTTASYRVHAYKTVSGKKVYGAYSATASVKVVPVAPQTVKVKAAGAGKATVQWKKGSKIDGYVVYQSLKKTSKFKSVGTVKVSKKSYTVKKLKKGKQYYFKVRAYKIVNKKKVYSPYSKTVSVKVKK
jgi:hypothetical protein